MTTLILTVFCVAAIRFTNGRFESVHRIQYIQMCEFKYFGYWIKWARVWELNINISTPYLFQKFEEPPRVTNVAIIRQVFGMNYHLRDQAPGKQTETKKFGQANR